MNPDILRGFVLWSVLSIASYFGIRYFFTIPFLVLLFLSLNLATFILMLLDKFFASLHTRRIPERVLYVATFFGGSVGMLVGMYLFHHKSRKTSFQFVVAILVLIQIGLILYLPRLTFSPF